MRIAKIPNEDIRKFIKSVCLSLNRQEGIRPPEADLNDNRARYCPHCEKITPHVFISHQYQKEKKVSDLLRCRVCENTNIYRTP